MTPAPKTPVDDTAAWEAPAQLVRLSGGNPQVPKGYGQVPIDYFIDNMPDWQHPVGKRIDAIVSHEVPAATKAVKWNSPFYGFGDETWFLSMHCHARYLRVTFFKGSSLDPPPEGTSKYPAVRYYDVYEDPGLDETRFARWVQQASRLPGDKI